MVESTRIVRALQIQSSHGVSLLMQMPVKVEDQVQQIQGRPGILAHWESRLATIATVNSNGCMEVTRIQTAYTRKIKRNLGATWQMGSLALVRSRRVAKESIGMSAMLRRRQLQLHRRLVKKLCTIVTASRPGHMGARHSTIAIRPWVCRRSGVMSVMGLLVQGRRKEQLDSIGMCVKR